MRAPRAPRGILRFQGSPSLMGNPGVCVWASSSRFVNWAGGVSGGPAAAAAARVRAFGARAPKRTHANVNEIFNLFRSIQFLFTSAGCRRLPIERRAQVCHLPAAGAGAGGGAGAGACAVLAGQLEWKTMNSEGAARARGPHREVARNRLSCLPAGQVRPVRGAHFAAAAAAAFWAPARN